LLILLHGFSAAALLGFATFTLRPELLNDVPGAARAYGQMFVLAPRLQILVAFAALALFLVRHVGTRWLPAFAALFAMSLGSELAGTTVGLPFGPYSYTDGLGFKVLGHVPLLIPLSWFFMALPSYAIARSRYPTARQTGKRIVLGSFILLCWDLALDPAMSLVTKYWVWETAGAYYGMPLLNLVGWYATGLVLMATLALLKADAWLVRLPLAWLISFYAANLILPLGMSAVAQAWGAVALTAAALGCCWLIAGPLPHKRRVEVAA
jgi:putative membrane protein